MAKTTTNRFIKLVLDESSASSGKSAFDGVVYGTTDVVIEWEIVSKMTEPYNTYPYSRSPHTKLTQVDIHLCLAGVLLVKTPIHAIAVTYATNNMDSN